MINQNEKPDYAKRNIRDAAYSMADELKEAEEDRDQLHARNVYLERRLSTLEDRVEKLDDGFLLDVYEIIIRQLENDEDILNESSKRVLENVDNPSSKSFQNAVYDYKAYTARVEKTREVRNRIRLALDHE